ncbi:MAG: S41 family peptidase [Chitinispirillaceae bacterium]
MKNGFGICSALAAVVFLSLLCQRNPVYDGSVDIEEQMSVWQYLKTYSIYQDRVPDDPFEYSSAESLFEAVGDTSYTNYYNYVDDGVTASAARNTDDFRVVYYEITDSTVLVSIREFSDAAYSEFLDLLPLMEKYRNIVVDLRGNGGGDLHATDSIVECFLPARSGYIQTRYRDYSTKERSGYTVDWDTVWTARPAHAAFEGKNFSVLINRRTASASEILASALKDCAGAYLVGERSYGKGIGQVRIPRTGRRMLSITFMQIRGVSDRTGNYHRTDEYESSDKGLRPDTIPADTRISGVGIDDDQIREIYYAVKLLERSATVYEVRASVPGNLRWLNKSSSFNEMYIVSEPDPLGH